MACLKVNMHNPLRTTASRPRRGYAVKIAVLALAIAGAAGYYFFAKAGQQTTIEPEMFHQAKIAPFVHDVVEQGEVQSARNVDVVSQVRGSRTANVFEILWVIEEGKLVKEGDVLVRLDSSALEEEAKIQRLDLTGSIAGLSKAENELAAAQIALVEYVKGTFLQERDEAAAEITLAQETLRRAEEYYAYSSRLAAKGYVTSLQLEGDRFAVQKAKIELENAQRKLKVLEDYTKEKTIKQLESAIGVAQADLESARERNSIEQKRLDFILEQIANCTIQAPAAGQVVYANNRGSRESSEFIVEQGAAVRERQAIIRLPDYSAMQINCLINESRVSMVDVGMSTTITLDAFAGLELTGTVVKVNEYPEPISRFGPQVKRYAAVVQIDSPPRMIKPGLTANVAIHVESLESALQVPVQSVFPHGTDYYCMVWNGQSVQPRKVKVGSNNSRFVVINEGLEENALVSMSPRRLLDEVEMPKLELAPGEVMVEDLLPGSKDEAEGDAPSRKSQRSQKSPGLEDQGKDEAGTQLAGQILSTYDTNGDGSLSAEELKAEGAQRYSAADIDGDGQVQRSELITSAGLLAPEKSKDDTIQLAEDVKPQAVGGAQ